MTSRSSTAAPILAVMVSLLATTSVPAADNDKLSANLTVEVVQPVLANAPLQFKLTITSTGTKPLSYWFGGPGRYPSARPFSVQVTDERGRKRTYPLSNGQGEEGSGGDITIETSEMMPAASDPLAPGGYKLVVSSRAEGYRKKGMYSETWPAMQAEPIEITVAEDAAGLADAESALLRQAKNDHYAHHVARVYGIDPIVNDWLRQLNSNDIKSARSAAGMLLRVRRLPSGGDEQLKAAAMLHVAPPFDDPDPTVLEYLARIARTIGTENSLDAILIIADSKVRPNARALAVTELGRFPGERAEKELLRLKDDKDTEVSWASISGLARRGNRAALLPLLDAVKEENPDRRRSSLYDLGMLRDLPEARAAITTALEDTDEQVRHAAKRALEREQQQSEASP